jgi:putative ATPase
VNSSDLFDYPVGMPLAARMRPTNLSEVVGQGIALNPAGPMAAFLSNPKPEQSLPSILLYGPPGSGKTTIARLLAKTCGRRLIEISAINATVKDLREAMDSSRSFIQEGKGAALVFVDEIHRFSKVQQESLLLAVENGEIVLIGATTENPLYALTSAMVSRASLMSLSELKDQEIKEILERAIKDERGLNAKFQVSDEALAEIARKSGGDARKALTVLEAISQAVSRSGSSEIGQSDVAPAMASALARYDATGDQHYDIISAFIKSVRGSDPDAALHWLARMLVGGEDPRFIARRLVILAAEDIGLADPSALTIANSTMAIVAQIGMPEGRIPLAECTIYLALAPKSNSAYLAINAAIADVQAGFTPSVPSHLRSSSLNKGDLEYEYPHDHENSLSSQLYLPEGDGKKSYYSAKANGFESTLLERFLKISSLRKNL